MATKADGMRLFNAGKPAEALAVFETLPDDPEARAFAAHCLCALGKPRDALRTLEGLSRDWPDFLPAHVGRATILRDLGDLPAACAALEGALALNPGEEKLKRPLSELLRDRAAAASGAEARALWERVLELAPRHPEALAATGGVRAPSRSPAARDDRALLERAEEQLRRGRRDPDALAPLLADERPARALSRLRALFLAGRLEEGLGAAEALASSVRDPQWLAALRWPWGQVYPDVDGSRPVLEGDLAALERLASRGVGRPWSDVLVGVLRRRCGRPDHREALERLREFREARHLPLWLELGRARMAEKDLSGAVEAFKVAQRAKPADWQAFAYCGEALARLGDARGCGAHFGAARRAAALALRPSVDAWHGQCRLWLGDPRALATLDGAAKKGAAYAFAWRGVARLALGDARAALADFDRALALKSWDLEALIWRGEAKRRLGDARGALGDLDAALALGDNAWARVHRALARLDLGDEPGDDVAAIRRLAPGLLRGGDRAALERAAALPHLDCRDASSTSLGPSAAPSSARKRRSTRKPARRSSARSRRSS